MCLLVLACLVSGGISYLIADLLHAAVGLCHPFLLSQMSGASTFPPLLSSRFQKGPLSVHDEVKSLSRLLGSPPTWGRDLPHTIAE